MTDFMKNGINFANTPFANPDKSTASEKLPSYYVREPLGKRAGSTDPEMIEGEPRAKRRFDKVSARLEQFSISRETENTASRMESSDDEEMIDDDASSSTTYNAIIEEPEEPPKRIKLDEKLHRYLQLAKQNSELLPQSLGRVRGDELTIWHPIRLQNPFDDPSMRGRIQEVENEGESAATAVANSEVAFPDDASTESEMSTASPMSTPPRIVELEDSASSSPISQDDLMETD